MAFNIANAGKHTVVSMPPRTVSPPAGAFSGTDRGFYSFVDPVTTRSEIYAHKSLAGGTQEIPITASILSFAGNPGAGSNGWSYLPSGILIKWGIAVSTLVDPTGVTTVNFPAPGNVPAFTQIFSVILCPTANSSSYPIAPDIFVTLLNFGTTFMRVRGSSRTNNAIPLSVAFQYIAIGM